MDRRGQGAAQAVVMAGQAGRGGRVPGRRGHRQGGGIPPVARMGPGMVGGQGRAAEPGFHAASLAAPAGRRLRPLLGRRPGQGGCLQSPPRRLGPSQAWRAAPGRRPSGARDHRAGHRRPGPAPSTASDSARQLASLARASGGPSRASRSACRAGPFRQVDLAFLIRPRASGGTRAAQAHGRPGSGSGGPAARRQGRQRRQGGAAVPGRVARRSRPTVRPTGSTRRASIRVPPGSRPRASAGSGGAGRGQAGGRQGAGVGRGRPPRPAAGAAGLGMLARCRC